MTEKLAIANRGEVARRIATTCRLKGIEPVLLIAEPDRDSLAAREIGRVVILGPAGAELDATLVAAAAQRAGASYLHPGYGFLSERPDLPRACEQAGVRFVGPTAETLELCGDKLASREVARSAGVPVLPASNPLGDDPDDWQRAAQELTYPVLVKAIAGGGGASLRRVRNPEELKEAVESSRREADAAGAGSLLYLERFLNDARHIEVQVVGDGNHAIALGDRECSLQRRHQKVIEEAPAPNLPSAVREQIMAFAVAVATAVKLISLATVEFLYSGDGTIAFIEVNPRLQVEHPVTEAVTGLDLVTLQLDIAAGKPLPELAPVSRGHAIEARLYAEDPARQFLPDPGKLTVFSMPQFPNVRVDAGYAPGDRVPDRYDPLLAKIISWGPERGSALARLIDALHHTHVAGVATNRTWLAALAAHPAVQDGNYSTQTAGRIETAVSSKPSLPLLAALTAHSLDRPPSDDPWDSVGPFRLDGTAELAFHDLEGNWEAVVSLQRRDGQWEMTVDDSVQPLTWWRDSSGVWTLRLGDEMTMSAIAARPDGTLEITSIEGRWLARPGRRPATTSRSSARSDGRVRAPLPGKVVRIAAEPDALVSEGEPLVILSAMKIEIVLRAPHAGRVQAIHCVAEQQVDAGDILVEVSLEENV